ncbi:hypothetical protein KR222_001168, partial [Zaprionus bogoriensis]
MERTAVPRGKRPRVQVSMNDKERAIARIRKGETKAGISRELGVPESTVRGWVKRADQRMAREAIEGKLRLAWAPTFPSQFLHSSSGSFCSSFLSPGTDSSSPPAALQLHSLKLPAKRDHNGQQVMRPMSLAVPIPMQIFQQAADSQLQLTGWLHIFNAGILNFTLIATAAYLRARGRGTTDRQSLWQIICEYVDEAGRNVANNGGQYVATAGMGAGSGISSHHHASRQLMLSAHCRNGGFVAPRLHITAEDDEDASMTATAMA